MERHTVLENDTETGKEVLIWISERGSKTRHGNGDRRAFNPTTQATNNERCPVVYYQKNSEVAVLQSLLLGY